MGKTQDYHGVKEQDDEDIVKLKKFMAGEWPREEEPAADDDVAGEAFVDTASSCSDSSVDDVDEETFYQQQSRSVADDIPLAVEGELLQNKKTKFLHKAADEAGTHTKCGLTTTNLIWLENGSRFSWPVCSKCFKVPPAGHEKSMTMALENAKRRRVAK